MPSFTRLLFVSFLLWATMPATARAAQDAAATPAPVRVLFVGNSLTYTNNLPRLVRAVAASQSGGPAIETATYAIPGADLDALWDDGHAAALLQHHHVPLALAQRGGLFSCIAGSTRDPECRRSESAHRRFTELATEAGARVMLLMTWPPMRGNDLGDASRLRRRAERLNTVYEDTARRWSRGGADVSVVPAAAALYRFAGGRASEEVLVDGVHPSVQASLLMAAQLYRAITGRVAQPADLLIDFPLLPANAMVLADAPLESQAQIAGDGSKVLLKSGAVEAVYAAVAE